MADLRVVSDAPARRHPGDIVRVALGTAAVAASAFAARRHGPGSAETGMFRLVNELPEAFAVPLRLLMQAGSVGALPTRRRACPPGSAAPARSRHDVPYYRNEDFIRPQFAERTEDALADDVGEVKRVPAVQLDVFADQR